MEISTAGVNDQEHSNTSWMHEEYSPVKKQKTKDYTISNENIFISTQLKVDSTVVHDFVNEICTDDKEVSKFQTIKKLEKLSKIGKLNKPSTPCSPQNKIFEQKELSPIERAKLRMKEREKTKEKDGRPIYTKNKIPLPQMKQLSPQNVIYGYHKKKVFMYPETRERVLKEKKLIETKFQPSTLIRPSSPINFNRNQNLFSLPTNISQYGSYKPKPVEKLLFKIPDIKADVQSIQYDYAEFCEELNKEYRNKISMESTPKTLLPKDDWTVATVESNDTSINNQKNLNMKILFKQNTKNNNNIHWKIVHPNDDDDIEEVENKIVKYKFDTVNPKIKPPPVVAAVSKVDNVKVKQKCTKILAICAPPGKIIKKKKNSYFNKNGLEEKSKKQKFDEGINKVMECFNTASTILTELIKYSNISNSKSIVPFCGISCHEQQQFHSAQYNKMPKLTPKPNLMENVPKSKKGETKPCLMKCVTKPKKRIPKCVPKPKKDIPKLCSMENVPKSKKIMPKLHLLEMVPKPKKGKKCLKESSNQIVKYIPPTKEENLVTVNKCVDISGGTLLIQDTEELAPVFQSNLIKTEPKESSDIEIIFQNDDDDEIKPKPNIKIEMIDLKIIDESSSSIHSVVNQTSSMMMMVPTSSIKNDNDNDDELIEKCVPNLRRSLRGRQRKSFEDYILY